MKLYHVIIALMLMLGLDEQTAPMDRFRLEEMVRAYPDRLKGPEDERTRST